MLLICIGDSITFGYGVNNKDNWTSLLNASNNLKFKVINKGINGNTTAVMLDRFFSDVISLKPTHSIIIGGTNDFLTSLNESYVFRNIELMCEEALENSIVPILASPLPIYSEMAIRCWASSADYKRINESLYMLKNRLKTYCFEKNILFIDLFSFYMDRQADFPLFYIDGLHPNVLGHQLIKNCFEKELSLL